MTVRAGMVVDANVSNHGRDRHDGHGTIFDLPVRLRASYNHPFPTRKVHPSEDHRHRLFAPRQATLASPGVSKMQKD